MKKALSFILCMCIILNFVLIFNVSSNETKYSLILNGRQKLCVPEVSSRTFYFTGHILDEAGNEIDAAELDVIGQLPDGVEFDWRTGGITVHDYATPGECFDLILSAPDEYDLIEKPYTITLTEDVLVNGSFSDYPYMSGWNTYSSSPLTHQGDEIVFTASDDEQSSYNYLLCQDDSVYLEENMLYVLRAKVRSEKGYETSRAYITNYATLDDGTITFNLFDIGGEEYNEVYCAFFAENTGIYNVAAMFSASDSRPIYVKDITLLKETNKPSKIIFSAPGAINAPKTPSFSLPFTSLVLDQEGNFLSAEPTISVQPENKGVEISDDGQSIIIYDNVKPGIYELAAELEGFPELLTYHEIRITESGIDDGGFEDNPLGVTWMPIAPSKLSVPQSQGNKYALFTPIGEIGVLYNNSYVSFMQENSYVLSIDLKVQFSDINTEVTVLIEDATNPDNLILAGYIVPTTQWNTYKCIFTPEESVVGRLIIAVNSPNADGEQLVYIDNAAVEEAVISARNVYISGKPVRGQTLVGHYNFINNFDAENASITKWLVSDTENGEYSPLSNINVNELEVTETIEGKYVQFCVTPMSLTAGITGATIYSDPIYVAEHLSYDEEENEDDPQNTFEPDNIPEDSEQPTEPPSLYKPVDLKMYSYVKNPFVDMSDHWAKNDVAVMSAAGITSGYEDKTFRPEKSITRAEFAALLVRAMGLDARTYTGKFADVSPESWYAGVIQTVSDLCIANGVTQTQFMPNEQISREQMAVMIMRCFAKIKTLPSYTSPAFMDINDISSYAREDVFRANALGIMLGTPDMKFEPQRSATRAEAVVMIKRLLDNLV